MTHERRAEIGDVTLFISSCECCPFCVERITFKSVIDECYDIKEKVCEKTSTKIENIKIIPIECPLEPRCRY